MRIQIKLFEVLSADFLEVCPFVIEQLVRPSKRLLKSVDVTHRLLLSFAINLRLEFIAQCFHDAKRVDESLSQSIKLLLGGE